MHPATARLTPGPRHVASSSAAPMRPRERSHVKTCVFNMFRRYIQPQLEENHDVPNKSAATALQQGSLGIGFSAGGLLFPYYVGIVHQLRMQGVLTDDTPVAGASAGSLIAACCKAGLTHEELVVATLELAEECRRLGTRHNLGPILANSLQRTLPADIHERANQGAVHVAVTRVLPHVQSLLINQFHSREDFISALLTSCHIPWYFDGQLTTKFRGEVHCDGGLTNFLPAPTGVTHTVRVCCFPSQQVRSAFGRLCISPDNFEAWPHDTRTMLGWAFNPGSDAMLLDLVQKGERDTLAWIAAEPGLADALQGRRVAEPQEVPTPSLVLPGASSASGAATSPSRADALLRVAAAAQPNVGDVLQAAAVLAPAAAREAAAAAAASNGAASAHQAVATNGHDPKQQQQQQGVVLVEAGESGPAAL